MKTASKSTDTAESKLRAWIATGLPEGYRLPSEATLAQEFRVSATAVNRAVQRLIAAGLLVRVGYKLSVRLAERREVPASPQDSAVPLQGACIACVVHASYDFATLERTLAPGIGSRGYSLLRVAYTDTAVIRRELRRLLAEPKLKGLAFWAPYIQFQFEQELRQLRERGVVVVVVGFEDVPFPTLNIDLVRACAAALGLLRGNGSRRPCLWVGYGPHSQAMAYQRAWRAAWEVEYGTLGHGPPLAHHFNADHVARYRESVRRLMGHQTGIDAFVCANPQDGAMLRRALRTLGHAIPAQVQIVVLYDDLSTRINRLTALRVNLELEARLALDLILHELESPRKAEPVEQAVSFFSGLIERSSTRPRPDSAKPAAAPRRPRLPGYIEWPHALESRRRMVRELRERPHAMAAEHTFEAFDPLRLVRWINRDVLRPKSWLGSQTLLHFPHGRHRIHGVPFDVATYGQTHHPGAIVFASRHVRSRGRVRVPHHIQIPLEGRFRALYWLHACGFVVSGGRPFAHYRILDAEGRQHPVPLMAWGPHEPLLKAAVPGPDPRGNIQDWWHDYPHHEGSGARYFVIAEEDDPMLYERYLYTLEWQNPNPRVPLKSLIIESDPISETTLAVLAITGLRPL